MGVKKFFFNYEAFKRNTQIEITDGGPVLLPLGQDSQKRLYFPVEFCEDARPWLTVHRPIRALFPRRHFTDPCGEPNARLPPFPNHSHARGLGGGMLSQRGPTSESSEPVSVRLTRQKGTLQMSELGKLVTLDGPGMAHGIIRVLLREGGREGGESESEKGMSA